jgi:hypothetical protein
MIPLNKEAANGYQAPELADKPSEQEKNVSTLNSMEKPTSNRHGLRFLSN